MHEYRRVSPKFWNGKTGKALKAKGPEAVIVALYLMTCQHSNMLGLYFVSPAYIAVDTGLGMEGASKGLQSACEVGFCRFDEDSEVVWVFEMAVYQMAEQLDAKDLRCKGVQNTYDALPDNPFLPMFFERYGAAFNMTRCRGAEKPPASPYQAPTKPGAGAGAGAEEGTEAGVGAAKTPAPAPKPAARAPAAPSPTTDEPKSPRATRKPPSDFTPAQSLLTWAAQNAPLVDAAKETEAFKDHTFSTAITDWPGAWRNWMRKANVFASRAPGARKGVSPATAEEQMSESTAKALRVARAMGIDLHPAADFVDMETTEQ